MATRNWNYTGTVQQWTVPANIDTEVPVRVKLAAPASTSSGGAPVVYGGYVEGDRLPVAGEVWYHLIGSSGTLSAGGYNGGGPPGSNSQGGAGATDIRIGSTNLSARIAVAGGPGGIGSTGGSGVQGGAGGGTTGASGTGSNGHGGGGGTQSAGGPAGGSGATAGSAGQGGSGGNGGGGGGAGLFGGGGGAPTTVVDKAGGGGGSNGTAGLTGVIVSTQAYTGTAGAAKIITTYSLIPSAPTLTSPSNNAYLDSTIDQPFTATFSSDDSSDQLGALEIRHRTGTGAWTSTGKIANTSGQYTFAALTFSSLNGQSVEWQVRHWGSATGGTASNWSASSYFTPVPPPAPFAFSPAPANPIVTNTPTLTGARTDGGSIVQYRMVAVPDDGAGNPNVGVILADTGIVTPAGSPTSLSVTLPSFAYASGGKRYHFLASIASPAGVWQHGLTDSGPLTANVAAPPRPDSTLELLTVDDNGNPRLAVEVTIINGTPSTPTAAATRNDIRRLVNGKYAPAEAIATGVAPNGSWIDEIPPGSIAGLSVTYEITAYNSSGSSTVSVEADPAAASSYGAGAFGDGPYGGSSSAGSGYGSGAFGSGGYGGAA